MNFDVDHLHVPRRTTGARRWAETWPDEEDVKSSPINSVDVIASTSIGSSDSDSESDDSDCWVLYLIQTDGI